MFEPAKSGYPTSSETRKATKGIAWSMENMEFPVLVPAILW